MTLSELFSLFRHNSPAILVHAVEEPICGAEARSGARIVRYSAVTAGSRSYVSYNYVVESRYKRRAPTIDCTQYSVQSARLAPEMVQ